MAGSAPWLCQRARGGSSWSSVGLGAAEAWAATVVGFGPHFPGLRVDYGGGWQFKAALDYVADLRGRVARHFRLAEA